MVRMLNIRSIQNHTVSMMIVRQGDCFLVNLIFTFFAVPPLGTVKAVDSLTEKLINEHYLRDDIQPHFNVQLNLLGLKVTMISLCSELTPSIV